MAICLGALTTDLQPREVTERFRQKSLTIHDLLPYLFGGGPPKFGTPNSLPLELQFRKICYPDCDRASYSQNPCVSR
jgi:hypothetical protein